MKSKIRILYIDENADDRLLVRKALRKNNMEFEVVEACSREEFEQITAGNRFDVVLSDINIPGFDGLQIIRAIKERDPDVPVIIVTRTGSEETAVQAMKTGAADYVIKTAKHIHTLAPAIKAAFADKKTGDEQKKMEEALQASEQNLREIHENSTILFYSHTPEHVLTYVSPQSRDFLGCEPEEAMVCWLDFLTDNPVNTPGIELTRRAIETGRQQPPYQLELRKKNGEFIWVEVNEKPVIKEGKVAAVVGSLTDITMRKKAEETIKLNNLRLHYLLELHKLMDASEKEVMDFVIEAVVNTVQSRFAFFGMLDETESVMTVHSWPKDVMEQCAIDKKPIIYPIADSGIWGDCVRQRKAVIINNYAGSHPGKKGTPAGHVPIKRFLAIPVFDGEKIVAVAAAANKETEYSEPDADSLAVLMNKTWEIIQRRRVEEELQKSRNRLLRFFEDDISADYLSTPAGKLLFCNTTFVKLFGFSSKEEALEYPVIKLYRNPSNRNEFLSLIRKNGKVENFECEYVSKDGRIIYALLNAAGEFDKAGELVEIKGYISDITDRKKMLQELIAAKEKAEESDRLKTVFLQNMSHEIRTPMNAILGFLNLLQVPDMENEIRKNYIDIIQKSGERLLKTINDIIEISKIESKQIAVQYSEVNIAEVMNHYLNFFKYQSEEKGLSLKLSGQIEGETANIETDKQKLDSILTNLINNAIKFTDKGSVEFGNYLEGNRLVFYVKDTGIGIPADLHEAIFDRFVQADMSNARQYEGSGLGLSIVKAYLELLNGKIWLESEPGKGTIFFFSIPYKPVKKQSVTVVAKEETGYEIEKAVTILIAEDDEYSSLYFEKILNGPAIKLLHSSHWKNTIRLIKENPDVSLILMDIKMSEMDGLECTRQIRQFNKTVPIIAQTAYSLPGDKEKAIESGCNDYITKPVRKDELLSLIKKYIP